MKAGSGPVMVGFAHSTRRLVGGACLTGFGLGVLERRSSACPTEGTLDDPPASVNSSLMTFFE